MCGAVSTATIIFLVLCCDDFSIFFSFDSNYCRLHCVRCRSPIDCDTNHTTSDVRKRFFTENVHFENFQSIFDVKKANAICSFYFAVLRLSVEWQPTPETSSGYVVFARNISFLFNFFCSISMPFMPCRQSYRRRRPPFASSIKCRLKRQQNEMQTTIFAYSDCRLCD